MITGVLHNPNVVCFDVDAEPFSKVCPSARRRIAPAARRMHVGECVARALQGVYGICPRQYGGAGGGGSGRKMSRGKFRR